MKKITLLAFLSLVLFACSNQGNKATINSAGEQNEIEITNDLENAKAKIPSWRGEVTIFDNKEKAHSGGFVCITNDTLEYSCSYDEVLKNLSDRLPKRVIFSGWVNSTTANPKFSIICGLNENGKQYDWNTFPLESVLVKPGTWMEFSADFYLDKKPLKLTDEIVIFAWNQSKTPIYMDDLKVRFLY